MEELLKYFPELTDLQRERFAAMQGLYSEWNSRINVISRKDMDNFYLHHVLHSLAIARVCRFDRGARVVDVGCGGGFPSVPLAVLFPDVRFTAVDSIGKKITVVKEVCRALGLTNVEAVNARVEQLPARFDYAVSRAVTDMRTFVGWVWPRLEKGSCGSLPNGILYLKGGDLAEELALTGRRWRIFDISEFFGEEFFASKRVVYTSR